LLFASCSLMPSSKDVASKFSTTTREDVSVFADQTMAMITDADLVFDASEAIYVRDYVDPASPEFIRFNSAKQVVKKNFTGIVKYSLQLVHIAETQPTEVAKVNAYADYLAAIPKEGRDNMRYSDKYYDEAIAEIRKQETFRDALIKAQPLVQAAGQGVGNSLDEFSEATAEIVTAIEKNIDKRYELVVKYQRGLEKEKQEMLLGLSYLYRATKGDSDAYKLLVDSKVIVDTRLLPKGEPTYDEMKKMGEYIGWKMATLHKIEDEISPDWEIYRAAHRELDQLAALAGKKSARARTVSMLWVRAHQKMAAGLSSPAEWIDYKDLPKMLIDLAL